MVYRSFVFKEAARFSLFLLPQDLAALQKSPVSDLIGVNLHSPIEQSHQSRGSRGTEKKEKEIKTTDCITPQTSSSLIRLQRYCGRCKTAPVTPRPPSLTPYVPKIQGGITSWGFDARTGLQWFGASISTGNLRCFISPFSSECSVLSAPPYRPVRRRRSARRVPAPRRRRHSGCVRSFSSPVVDPLTATAELRMEL